MIAVFFHSNPPFVFVACSISGTNSLNFFFAILCYRKPFEIRQQLNEKKQPYNFMLWRNYNADLSQPDKMR